MKLNITALADRMIWFITLIFLVLSLTISFALGEANYGAYVLFVCLFGLIIFYLIREQGVIKLRFNWMHAYMLIFIGACYLSAINATDVSVAMSVLIWSRYSLCSSFYTCVIKIRNRWIHY